MLGRMNQLRTRESEMRLEQVAEMMDNVHSKQIFVDM